MTTKKAGRPTTDEVAERNWGNLPNEMKAKVPDLIKQGMVRVSEILNDKDASHSNVLRAFKDTIDIYKYMVELEQKDAEAKEANELKDGDTVEQPVQGLALISLTAAQH